MDVVARRGDEQGAVAIVVAIVLLVLFTITAMAIDLGFAQADVRQNQSMSDFASLAAGLALDDGYEAACQAALVYLDANADDFPTVAGNPCSAFATLDNNGCTAATAPVTATITSGPYTVLVTSPVDDGDPAMQVEGQTVTANDGDRCDRVKVEVTRDRDYIFGGIIGIAEGSPVADAVALKVQTGTADDYASLIVLERHACNALTASGTNTAIEVIDGTGPTGPIPGTIAVDSAGDGGTGNNNCNSGNRWTVDHGTGRIWATGEIQMFALAQGNTATAYNPARPAFIGDGLVARTNRMTRRPVDWKYNCVADYATPTHQRYPAAGDDDIGACPDAGTIPAYIDTLWGQLQPAGTPPGDVVTVSACPAAIPTVLDANSVVQFPSGPPDGVHVTCDPTGNTMVLNNFKYVVFDQKAAAMRLHVQGPTDTGTVLYFRGPGLSSQSTGPSDPCDLALTGDAFCLRNVFVYVESPGTVGNETNDPSVSMNNASVTWTSLTTSATANCDPTDPVPVAACFAPLALWSNSQRTHSFAGSGVAMLVGSFFTPNGLMQLSGGSGFDFEDAQFFARTIGVSGGGTVRLKPNPETNIPTPLYGVGLIR